MPIKRAEDTKETLAIHREKSCAAISSRRDVTINLRSILARAIEAEPFHAPDLSFEMRETIAFVQSELRYVGIGTKRLPPWSLPFQLVDVPDNWRGRRTAEAAAALIVAVNDKHGIRRKNFMPDEWNFLEILRESLERAGGFLDEWRRRKGDGYAILDGVPLVVAPRGNRVCRNARTHQRPQSHPAAGSLSILKQGGKQMSKRISVERTE
jgi:hypothetical protein